MAVTLRQLRQRAELERPEKDKVVSGKYMLIKKLGMGGYGSVWLVRNERSGEQAALKLLGVAGSKDEYAIQALKNEFSILKDLNHPHICKIQDFGVDDLFGCYFVSEYVDGEDFFASSEGRSVGYIEELFIQILRALSYLHSNGVFHFDLKPGNILVQEREDRPYAAIIDFGISAFHPPKETVGTAGYMSPEMILKHDPDGRSDLYSVGVLLYEALTRKNPFLGINPAATMKNHLSLTPLPPSKANLAIPPYFDVIVSKLLQKDPADRHQSTGEAIRELKLFSERAFEVETIETRVAYVPVEGRLIGWHSEREKIKQLLGEFKKGSVSINTVSILGGRGVGKSRFLRDVEFKAKLAGFRTITVVGEDETSIQDAAEKVGTIPLGVDIPVVICIDDLDRLIDQSIFQPFLSTFSNLKSNSPVLIVYTSQRREEKIKSDFTITLFPFTKNELVEYIQAIASPPKDALPRLATEYMNHTHGNPALVTCLTIELIRRGFMVDKDGRWDKTDFSDISPDFERLDIGNQLKLIAAEIPIQNLSPLEKYILVIMSDWHAREDEIVSVLSLLSLSSKKPGKVLRRLVGQHLVTFNHTDMSYHVSDNYLRTVVKKLLPDNDVARIHDKIAEFLIKKHGHKNYQSNLHLAYGSDPSTSDEALVHLCRHERQHGRVMLAIDRITERISNRLGGEKYYDALLLELGKGYFHIREFDKAISVYKGALSVSRNVSTYQSLCRTLIEKGDLKEARIWINKALNDNIQNEDKIIFNNMLGRISILNGDYGKATLLFEETDRQTKLLPKKKRLSIDNNELGESLRLSGNIEKAIPQLENEAAEHEKKKQWNTAALRRFSLAEAYRSAAQHKAAECNFRMATQYAKRSQNTTLLSCIYNGLAGLLMGQEQMKEATEVLKKGLKLAFRTGELATAAAILVNMGHCFNDFRDFTKAKNYLFSSLHYLDSKQERPGWVSNLKCPIYLELGDIAAQEHDYQSAKNYLDEAFELAKEKEELTCYLPNIQKILAKIQTVEGSA